ncbi:MAG TPA: hypothetical protein VF202_02405 [Trueperaceae bacterium]
MSDVVVEAGFIRLRHVGEVITEGPEMTPENVDLVVHALRRASQARARAREARARVAPSSDLPRAASLQRAE